MLLHPVVARVQRRIPRRGPAVMIVTLWAVLVFIGLNLVVMSKTVRISPLLVFIAVLVGASLGTLIGGFVAALLAIPTAGALQVLVKEVWQATAPDQPQETPAPEAEPADRCSDGEGI